MKKGRLLYLIIFAYFIGCGPAKDNEWGYKKSLPKGATEVKEFYWTDGFLPDYEYYLKARITRTDFLWYCDTFNLILHTDTSAYTDDIGNLNLGGSIHSDSLKHWWDTKTNMDSLFVWQRGDEWNIARYFGGYLYLYAHEH